jgi:diketogulonate reductase-like aldo/keto reductase
MEDQVKAGRAKAIGVSNFNKAQVERLLKNCTIPPANNQVELHAYLQQPELVKYCQDNKVSITSYATLGSPGRRDFFKAIGFEGDV